jgi:valyl-tRNA synthetase
VDAEAEISKLETELTRLQGFLEGVRKKLSNESFTAHAPEKVVAIERKKEADALLKIENIEKSLKSLKSK